MFVDREQELATLQGHLAKALAGDGQVCFVAGQAGSGKTALVRHFVEQALASNTEVALAAGSCNAQTGTGDPYLPFREALAMLTGQASARGSQGGGLAENDRRLRTILVRSVQILVEVAPDLVGVLVPGGKLIGEFGKAIADKVGWMDRLELLTEKKGLASGAGDTPAEQTRILEQYTTFLQKLSQKMPLILFLDDLQWADGASINLIFHLGRRLESSRVLILGSYRPNDLAAGRDGKRHPLEPVLNELTRYYGDITVDLDTISVEGQRKFVDSLLDSEPNALGEEFRAALFRQTGGHALYTVELLRAMQERENLVKDSQGRWIEGPSLDWRTLPARVEGVIEERIDRLGPDLRELLQVASIEGERFTAEVMARVQSMAEREVVRQLSGELQRRHRLVQAQGLAQVGYVRLSLYRFAHNLFYHYMYNSLSDAEQLYLHRDVGQALEELVGGQTDEVAAQLAHHFERAGLLDRAVPYRLQAANRARRLSGHDEAAAHLVRGLELAAELPPGPQQMQLETELQITLGMVLIALHGYASPRVDRAFTRARVLLDELGNPPQAAQLLLGQLVFYLMRGEIGHVATEGKRIMSLTEHAGNVAFTLTGHLLLGIAAMYSADYDGAREHLEKVIALYHTGLHAELAHQYGQDPGVGAYSFLSRTLWLQGLPNPAREASKKSLALAEEVDHPYSRTMASIHAATLHSYMREWPECYAEASRAFDLAREWGFGAWEANASMLRALAVVHQGEIETGLADLTRSLFVWEATGAGLVSYGRTGLAEAYLVAGKRAEGLRAIDEALYPNEEAWYLPEQYRLKAELLLLAPGFEQEADALLRQALDLAREQKSRALELRTALSLARLYARQGRRAEGHAILASGYALYQEGQDTIELRQARELLATVQAEAREPEERPA
ncbi:MAG TPA: AAA family ATPase [Anaerolineae bacterium]|nr:AAA family ATPase [Anaerolineae bacterium]